MILFTSRVFAQKQKTIVIADVTGYTLKLPVSNNPEWKGNDTLVPAVIDGRMSSSNIMGAEYLKFSHIAEGIDPGDDSTATIRKTIRRSRAKINNNLYTWTFYIDQPQVISNDPIFGSYYLIQPGDSIHINYSQATPFFTGRGAAKFQLTYNSLAASETVFFPDKRGYPLDLERFLKRSEYLNEKIHASLSVLDANRNLISSFEYNWIKGKILTSIENSRTIYFINTWQGKIQDPSQPFSYEDISRVWDTTMYQPTALWLRSPAIQNMLGIGRIGYITNFHMLEIHRKYNFYQSDSISNRTVLKKMLFNEFKSNYMGLFRERLLCEFLVEEIIQEGTAPYNWAAKAILEDYYSISEFPAYKAWIKQGEKRKEDRYKGVTLVGQVPLFTLKDQEGNDYNKRNTEGKFTIINFWHSGSDECVSMSKQLKVLQEKYKDRSNVLFLNVSVDKDKARWEESIMEAKWASGGVQLWTAGRGKDHEMIKDFYVTEFPTIRIYDQEGKIVIDEKEPFARVLSVEKLDAIIGKSLVKLKDGPYLLYNGNSAISFSIEGTQAKQINYRTGDPIIVQVSNDENKTFLVPVQKAHTTERSEFARPDNMIVLSDIEGNLDRFRKLLQSNKIIDDKLYWTFGKGHLVFAGDMFDRGEQVTECLWLIYSLEEKAKAAGGMVHFILGNHEIMNLKGNDKYVVGKYKSNYKLLGKSLKEIYGEDSELGRWLRTKNIVEKIGDILFMHGGVSSELNNTNVTIEEINKLARPHYDDTTRNHADPKLNIIMSSKVGPFWFRGYYEGKPVESLIDSTLKKFSVSRIVTGHTVIADTISVLYNGKIINTDTKHASGKSEALLIEGTHFYRVNGEGKRVLLFIDDKRKITTSKTSSKK